MITVVRHGRTATNAAGCFLGHADPPLDAVGESQAQALGAALGAFDLVVSSPLQRCRATAECLGGPVEVDDRWIELDYGEWDGRALSSVTAEEWRRWREDPHFAPPGGETLVALGARVRAALDELAERARDAEVAVVTHVSPIKAAVAWALGVDDSVVWRMFVAPASVTRIAVGGGVPSLTSFNETGHLGRGGGDGRPIAGDDRRASSSRSV